MSEHESSDAESVESASTEQGKSTEGAPPARVKGLTKRRRKRVTHPLPESWTVSKTFTHNGRHIERGTELSIKGERGRFRFISHVSTEAGAEWITVVGGPAKVTMTRSFKPDRIRTVHRLTKTREGQAAKEGKGKGKGKA
jgi:hypothetical protein